MNKKRRKIIGGALALGMTLAALTGLAGCGDKGENGEALSEHPAASITVISREDGSGTRGAFVELFGILEEDGEGNKVDMTIVDADITSSTSVMMTSVAGNPYAIGYVSIGSMNDTVKALKIDGSEATAEAIKSEKYKISRPFNIAVKAKVSAATQEFINFILSEDGQKVIEDNGYISAGASKPYEGTQITGKIVVAGSSSVTPVMEKLKEAYLAVNPNAAIEIQQSDSTTGITSTIEGICDIGMASRALKESELTAGLAATTIATDGIAVIVNKDNPIEGLTSQQVKAIFTGEATTWGDVME